LGGVLYQHGLAVGTPREVTPQALSDRGAVPDGTVVSVHGEVRLDTRTETSRGNALLALANVPDVVVFGDNDQPECLRTGSAARTLVGEIQSGSEKDVDGVVEKFAKRELQLDRSRVRVLNVRGDAGSRGASTRSIVFIVLASIFGAFTLMGLVRMLILRGRVQRDEAAPGLAK
jgi:hypothetical protein